MRQALFIISLRGICSFINKSVEEQSPCHLQSLGARTGLQLHDFI